MRLGSETSRHGKLSTVQQPVNALQIAVAFAG